MKEKLQIIDFTVEYRKNPIGLDCLPRFSWKIKSKVKNTMQVSYQIIVRNEEQLVWDSGKADSEQSLFVPYEGIELTPVTAYQVNVTVWDNHGNCGETEGTFETGLLTQDNWQADWITHEFPEEETACPVFTKKFAVSERKIKRARAYATSCGVYELHVNGTKAGDAFLAPGWTSYHNRLQYQTYDITSLLESAKENQIQIIVGNGWYKGYLNGEGESCFYGDRTAVLAMIRILYEDGTQEIIGTDDTWMVTDGIIRSSELYMGEKQDFTIKNRVPGVRRAVAFDAKEKVASIVAQESEPVRIVKQLPVKEKIMTPKGELVLDFGQNMPGFVAVKLPPLTGDSLIISHAETLDKYGNFYTENLRTARATEEYVYGAEEVDRMVMPHFTYHGFRYIRLQGVSEDVDISRFTACVLHTDMQQTGTFHCSNPLIEQLQSNIEWGQRSNFVDIPTDCPQRDERLGWTGDAQIFCRTAVYNFNAALLFKKWLRDVAAETDDEHGVPHIVPNIVGPATGTAVWSDCATVIPWTLYTIYGDKGVLKEQYGNMRQWVEYIRRSCKDQILWMHGFQRGDWLALDGDESLHPMSGGTDKNLVANVYYAYSTRIVRDAANVLGKKQDAKKYAELYKNIVEELNREYITKNGRLVSETQTACTLLLYFDLVKEEYRSRIIQSLEDNIILHKGHLTTGFVGTAYLCHALTDNRKHQLAEDILLAEDYPGWLYAVRRGATTIWERWNSILPNGDFDQSGMNSLNHYSYGAIGDWLYRKPAGINILQPGYKKILIRPVLTRSMTEVFASLESMYGTIKSHVSCKNGTITVDVEIPANTTAILELPEREDEIEVGSGEYHFEYATNTHLEQGAVSMNTTVGEILEMERGAEILDKYVPGTSTNPMLGYLKSKTLNELAAMAPPQKELFEKMIREFVA